MLTSRWLAAAALTAVLSGCTFLYTSTPRYGCIRPKPVRPAAPVHAIEAARGSLPWPVQGTVVAGFGAKESSKYGTKTRSLGITIACRSGSAVCAVGGGRVSYADQFMGMGRMVILEHGGGFHSVYARLAEMIVTVGARVSEGQQIGTSGDTLHFELRVGGKPVDPLEWLGSR